MAEKKTPKKRNALGRGLGALLEDIPITSGSVLSTDKKSLSRMVDIPLDQIDVNPFQPRTDFDPETLEELAESIRIQGIIQPITVRRFSHNKYQLITGERRVQATRIAGIASVPAFVREANDQQMLELALIENIQRENLNAMEIAFSYQRLVSECNLKQEELGERVGKKRATVTNYLRLLKLPPDIQAAIRDNQISMGHARALVNIVNPDIQLSIYHRILRDDLSVRKAEELARQINQIATKVREKSPKPRGLSPELQQLQGILSSHFGTKVRINDLGKNKGELKIPYMSVDDLNRILDILEVHL
ncbi:ParB/RepB/Spo0J family partition protein [Bacteroidota bacterium]